MKSNNWIGLDIGGANIKVAGEDQITSHPFELWKHPETLGSFLASIVDQPTRNNLAVTMTGELADGYASREEGVCRIVEDVETTFRQPAVFYQTTGKLVAALEAKNDWQLTAAANWHALANWIASNKLADGFLLDIGSTTTDLIPLEKGTVVSGGATDFERLKLGELIYSGIGRSSVSGFMDSIEVDGVQIPIANELFATIGDARVVTLQAGLPTTISCPIQ